MPFTQKIGIYQNQPVNVNFLATHRFRVVLHRAPNVNYFVQKANLPAISFGNATYPNPLVDIPVPGDKLRYEDFTMSFPVDEDMGNYKEIASWITGLTFPKQFGQYKDLTKTLEGTRSDISLIILDSAHNPKHTVRYRNAYPYSLSELDFDVTVPDTDVPLVTATFKYVLWEFEEVNANTPTSTAVDRINS